MNKRLLLLILVLFTFIYVKANVDSQISSSNSVINSSNYEESKKVAFQLYGNEEFLKALPILKSLIRYKKSAEISLKLGHIYSFFNEYDKAHKYFLESKKLSNNEINSTNIDLNIEIANLYYQLEDSKNSLTLLKEAFNDSKSIGDSSLIIKSLSSLGVIYGKSNVLDSSLLNFKLATNYVKDTTSLKLAGLLNNIGAIFFKMKDIENALNYYNKAYSIFASQDHLRGIATSTFNFALIKKEEKNYKESIAQFNEAVKLFEDLGSLYYLDECYRNLANIYDLQENWELSNDFLKKHIAIKDSIFNNEVLTNIANEKNKFEILKIEKSLELLEKDNELKETKQNILIIGFITFIIIAISIFINLRTNLKNSKLKSLILEKEKKELDNELQYNRKELETFALKIVKKNETLEELKNQISEVKTNLTNKDELKSISKTISDELYIDQDRQDFNLKVEQLHAGFFAKLKTHYPNLTKNDIKLCSLIVLDLTSKDMSILLNISPDSVKKSRYRLRKKMNLDTEVNLTNFLKNL